MKVFFILVTCLCRFGYGENSPALEMFLQGAKSAIAKNGCLQVNHELQEEILAMQREDQAARAKNMQNLFEEIDKKHNPRLKEIIATFGWPAMRLVGIKGSSAMWLLVQHQDRDVAFQKECLWLLKDAVTKQDAQYRHYAYLLDRVRMNDNLPQVYGTQWIQKEGNFVLYTVEDLENLNQRRFEAGLVSIEEYIDIE